MSKNFIVNIKHDSPTFKQFVKYRIQEACPTFVLDIEVKDDKNICILSLTYKIEGHYYCSGSVNFDIEKFILDKVESKKTIDDTNFDIIFQKIQETLETELKETLIERTYYYICNAELYEKLFDN